MNILPGPSNGHQVIKCEGDGPDRSLPPHNPNLSLSHLMDVDEEEEESDDDDDLRVIEYSRLTKYQEVTDSSAEEEEEEKNDDEITSLTNFQSLSSNGFPSLFQPFNQFQPVSSPVTTSSDENINQRPEEFVGGLEEEEEEDQNEDEEMQSDLNDGEYVPSRVEMQSEDSDSEMEEDEESAETEVAQLLSVTSTIKGKKRRGKRNSCAQVDRQSGRDHGMVPEEEDDDKDDSDYSQIEFIYLENGYRIPTSTWNRLFPYQQNGVKWLWELHQGGCGGIIGDEMGLGKTIQIIAFLYGLSLSDVSNFRERNRTLGPTLLVCPATIMHQWVNEIDRWFPGNKVTVLHHTSPYKGSKRKLIHLINRLNGILITSYSSILIYQDLLQEFEWHYVILDEGHKIRNPEAQTTIACKRFATPHRIILSGSPIQNNLKELWSLFDFVYPSKLGTLPIFMEQFAVPITQGGYSNASDVQVQIAYRCASVLRDTIKPYLLRRMKENVKMTIRLPNKNEQVLFCRLTTAQRKLYADYLKSADVVNIIKGSTQMFVGLVNLRKICNHPDLFVEGHKLTGEQKPKKEDYGYHKRAGKMKVVACLLKEWRKQNHKVLIFTQGRQMLEILEKFLKDKEYPHLVMDGSTSMNVRPKLIRQFNTDDNIFVFLLTTRVGGLGINLTGADRIIIYDPDWNPSTDMQARERAWRIGQDRQVTIYRLLTAGTVEEKIYHRQIFKQFLTNKILKDPKQKRFFKTNDLFELFTLGSDSKGTESMAIFAGTGSEVKVNKKAKRPNSNKSRDEEKSAEEDEQESPMNIELPPEKIDELKQRAKMLSQLIAKKFNQSGQDTNNSQQSSEETTEEPQPSTSRGLPEKTSKKKSKLPKKKNTGAVCEGQHIKYLVSTKVHEDQLEDEEELNEQQDEYVLRKLFKKTSTFSALQHDVIEGVSNPDAVLIEKEADRVAKDAIRALQRSREAYQTQANRGPGLLPPIGSTMQRSGGPSNIGFGSLINQRKLPSALVGKSVSTGLPVSSSTSVGNTVNNFTVSKTSTNKPDLTNGHSLLAAIKERNKMGPGINGTGWMNTNGSDDEVPQQFKELVTDLRSFFALQPDYRSTTDDLIQHFGPNRLPKNQTVLFRSLLWKMCTFERNKVNKTAYWLLNPEFR